MQRPLCRIFAAIACFQVAVVVIYLILQYSNDERTRISTMEEKWEERQKTNSTGFDEISTKYSSFKNVRTQCSQLTFSFAAHVTQPNFNNKNTNIFLLVLITSGVEKLYYERRNSVRSTWGNKSTKTALKNWERVFVLGNTLNTQQSDDILQEAAVFNDILVVDMKDNYNNIVIKIFSGLLWSLIYVNPRFILKADDDVYVRVPYLISWLDNYANDNYAGDKLYGGYVIGDGEVKRAEKWKNRVARDCLAEDYYPPYCAGPFYIISSRILPSIFQTVQKRTAFPVEDAYMSILVRENGLKPVNIPGFNFRTKLADYGRCDWASAIAMGHSFNLTDFMFAEKNLEETNELPRNYYKCLMFDWMGFIFLLISPIVLFSLVYIFVKLLTCLRTIL